MPPMLDNQTSQRIGNYRWVICTLLFVATTINYIDRQILALVKEFLDAQFGWSKSQFGLVNAMFQGAYGLGLLWFGWFVDKKGVRAGYAVSMIGWSIAAIAHAFVALLPKGSGAQAGVVTAQYTAMAVGAFGFCRVLLGLAEAGNFPSAIKAVAQWFPKRDRAFATSIFNAGTNVGAIIAPAIVPVLAIYFGWPAPFVIAGVVGFLWLFFWLPMYDSPDKHKHVTPDELNYIRSDTDEQASSAKIPWGSLLKYPQTWSFITSKFLTDPVWWFFLIWLPDFFKETRSLDIKKSWVHLVCIYSIITVLSIIGGWITGYLTKQGWSVTRARKTGMFIFALLVVPILWVNRVGNWEAVLLIGLAGAAHQAWSANLYTTVSDMFPKQAVASVVGLGGMAGSFGGMLFPILTGMLLDSFKKNGGSITAGYTVLFSVCAFAYLLAFVINHLLARRYEQITLPTEQ